MQPGKEREREREGVGEQGVERGIAATGERRRNGSDFTDFRISRFLGIALAYIRPVRGFERHALRGGCNGRGRKEAPYRRAPFRLPLERRFATRSREKYTGPPRMSSASRRRGSASKRIPDELSGAREGSPRASLGLSVLTVSTQRCRVITRRRLANPLPSWLFHVIRIEARCTRAAKLAGSGSSKGSEAHPGADKLDGSRSSERQLVSCQPPATGVKESAIGQFDRAKAIRLSH
jgi:hypothetical protein